MTPAAFQAPAGWQLTKTKEGKLVAVHPDGSEAWLNRHDELEIDGDHSGALIPADIVRKLIARAA